MNQHRCPIETWTTTTLRAGLSSALGLLLIAVLVLGGVQPPPALATPGDLDPTFGENGVARSDFGGSERITALAIQPDGYLVAAGAITWPAPRGTSPPEPTDALLARYHPDGSLDLAFGTEGHVVTDFDAGYDVAAKLVIQPDGKLVVAGWSGRGGTPLTFEPADFALARYHPDGTLDSSFGTDGRVLTSFGGHAQVTGLVLQPDSKLVAVGTRVTGSASAPVWSIVLARYNPDGSLDPTFGTEGRVITSFGVPDSEASALAIQPDGKLVVAGETPAAVGRTRDFAVARFGPAGSLDESFGTGGVVTTDFGGHEDASALALQPDGTMIVAGTLAHRERPPRQDVALARYTADGALDADFGDAGRVIVDFGVDESAYALALAPEGGLTVAGGAGQGDSPVLPPDFLLLRLGADGTLDNAFGSGGRVVADLGANSEWATALVMQPDGKPVLGGYSPGNAPTSPSVYVAPGDFALVRYLAD
jgi:uncharacterized delta-60 repeat protein